MASSVTLFLDLETDGAIISPSYTTNDAITHIRITSNEILQKVYDIKIIDALGNEHLYSDQFPNATEYEMEITFGDFPFGTTTVYASISDVVGNTKILTPKSLVIYETSELFVTITDQSLYDISLSDSKPYKINLTNERVYVVSPSNERVYVVSLSDERPYVVFLSNEGGK